MLSSGASRHTPPLCSVSSTPPRSSSSLVNPTTVHYSSMAASVRIVIVGDIHDQWNLEEDTKALQLLQPDLVLFTGDFGNENAELVQNVADLKFPKAAILGNHDSWYTPRFSEKKKDGVQLQLESLGEEHVGYKRLDFPALNLSVVGGRPFSCGGEQLFRKRLLFARYGIQDMDGSARRIYNTALGTPEDHSIVILAHNGPTGLGSNLDDICGKDWVFGGGDHGDPDLAQAISNIKETAKLNLSLVVFGHMHKELAHGNGLRKMIAVDHDNTIYLNGAIVPRVKSLVDEQGASSRSFERSDKSMLDPESGATIRAFTLVELKAGRVHKIVEVWVSVVGNETAIQEEQILFENGTRFLHGHPVPHL